MWAGIELSAAIAMCIICWHVQDSLDRFILQMHTQPKLQESKVPVKWIVKKTIDFLAYFLLALEIFFVNCSMYHLAKAANTFVRLQQKLLPNKDFTGTLPINTLMSTQDDLNFSTSGDTKRIWISDVKTWSLNNNTSLSKLNITINNQGRSRKKQKSIWGSLRRN